VVRDEEDAAVFLGIIRAVVGAILGRVEISVRALGLSAIDVALGGSLPMLGRDLGLRARDGARGEEAHEDHGRDAMSDSHVREDNTRHRACSL
jgi:hypothetical protein